MTPKERYGKQSTQYMLDEGFRQRHEDLTRRLRDSVGHCPVFWGWREVSVPGPAFLRKVHATIFPAVPTDTHL